MDVTILDRSADIGQAVARRMADALARIPELVLGLPAGSTPVEAYAELMRLHAAGGISFARATVFLLDEFLGLAPPHHGSFRRFVTEHLLSGIDLAADRIHSLNGVATHPESECERYEESIAAAGGLGLVLLGIGSNGHVAFNEPGDELVARTHRVALLESTRLANVGAFGGDLHRVPAEALSMGIGTILRADAIILMATGPGKADAVARMLRGPVTPRLPASFLQMHRRVEVLLDRAAAAQL